MSTLAPESADYAEYSAGSSGGSSTGQKRSGPGSAEYEGTGSNKPFTIHRFKIKKQKNTNGPAPMDDEQKKNLRSVFKWNVKPTKGRRKRKSRARSVSAISPGMEKQVRSSTSLGLSGSTSSLGLGQHGRKHVSASDLFAHVAAQEAQAQAMAQMSPLPSAQLLQNSLTLSGPTHGYTLQVPGMPGHPQSHSTGADTSWLPRVRSTGALSDMSSSVSQYSDIPELYQNDALGGASPNPHGSSPLKEGTSPGLEPEIASEHSMSSLNDMFATNYSLASPAARQQHGGSHLLTDPQSPLNLDPLTPTGGPPSVFTFGAPAGANQAQLRSSLGAGISPGTTPVGAGMSDPDLEQLLTTTTDPGATAFVLGASQEELVGLDRAGMGDAGGVGGVHGLSLVQPDRPPEVHPSQLGAAQFIDPLAAIETMEMHDAQIAALLDPALLMQRPLGTLSQEMLAQLQVEVEAGLGGMQSPDKVQTQVEHAATPPPAT